MKDYRIRRRRLGNRPGALCFIKARTKSRSGDTCPNGWTRSARPAATSGFCPASRCRAGWSWKPIELAQSPRPSAWWWRCPRNRFAGSPVAWPAIGLGRQRHQRDRIRDRPDDVRHPGGKRAQGQMRGVVRPDLRHRSGARYPDRHRGGQPGLRPRANQVQRLFNRPAFRVYTSADCARCGIGRRAQERHRYCRRASATGWALATTRRRRW